MKKILSIIVIALFIFGCSEDEKSSKTSKFKPFQNGDELVLKGVLGNEITLKRQNDGFVIKGAENKTLMIDIFGTFCPPCQKEAPAIMDYQLKNDKDFMIIGLTHFENVSNDYVLNEFIKPYNAYYFITNDQKINDRLVQQVTKDIGYNHEIALPFKVVLKDSKYQELTDVDSSRFGVKYYLGGITTEKMQKDLERINKIDEKN